MSIAKKIFFTLLTANFTLNLCLAQNKLPVVIIPECTSAGINLSTAKSYTSYIESEFVKSRRFTVVDRKSLDKILTEVNLQMTGLTNSENAKNVGKLLNADKFVFTTVSRTGRISMVDEEEQFVVKLDLVDIETAAIEYSYNETTNGISNVYKSLSKACTDLMNKTPLTVSVLSVSSDIAYINAGKQLNLEKGKVYSIQMITKLVRNSKNEVVFQKKEVVGKLAINQAEESSAEILLQLEKGFIIKENDTLELIPI